MSQSANTPAVTLTGANTYTGTTYVNGIIVRLNSTDGPAINGPLIISGGNNNGTDSLPITNSTIVLLQNDQIAPTSDVIVNGGVVIREGNLTEVRSGGPLRLK